MPYLLLSDFSRGIDRRRLAITSLAGSLRELTNAHITRGGEIEKRKAFVEFASLVGKNTFGLHSTGSALYTFGSAADPGMPTGVTYQRLQNASFDMTAVLATANFNGKIYAIASYSDGSTKHFYNGILITDWEAIADATGLSTNTKIATRFATLIDNSEHYSATVSTNVVRVTGETGVNFKAKVKAVNQGPDDDQAIAKAYVSGPTTGASATPKIIDLTFTGTRTGDNSGDVYSVKLTDPDTGTHELFIVRPASTVIGEDIEVLDGKIYSLASSLLYFSEISGPKKWLSQSNGAGFIDLTIEDGSGEQLTALAIYQGNLAIFSKRHIHIWNTDPDPLQNRRRQILRDTGTTAPRSVVQYGDLDVFYLDAVGVRSLRARELQNIAAVSDIGAPIDTLIAEDFPMVSAQSSRQHSVGIIEPQDGRYWLAIGGSIYVFSYFPGTKIEAWGKYTASYASGNSQVAFNVTDMAQMSGLVYVRGNNSKVYQYGGASGLTYDNCEVEAVLPLLDAGKPADRKTIKSIDVSAEGTWKIFLGSDSTSPDAREEVGEIEDSSWDQARIPAIGVGTHFSVKVKSSGSGRCVLGSLAIDYDVANR